MSLRFAYAAIGIALAYPCGMRAQTVMGRVVDSASRKPVAKLAVRLIPASDTARDTTYAEGETAQDGVFLLNAPKPGSYRIRLGATHVTPAITLATADAEDQHEYVVGPDPAPAPAPAAPAGRTSPGAPAAPAAPAPRPTPAPGAPPAPPSGADRR